MKLNVIYDFGIRVTSSWCFEQGFVDAIDNCGYLNYAYNISSHDEINYEELAKYPTIIPTGSLPKFYSTLEKVKGKTKLILVETESIQSTEGFTYPYAGMMKSASEYYDEIYTHCYEDSFDYFGRKVKWTPGFINVEMFRPLEIRQKPKQKMLFVGYKNKYRDWLLLHDPDEVYIDKRKTMPSLDPRENSERLNKLIHGYDYYLSPRSIFRGVNGKIFQGCACRKLVFVQNDPYQQKGLFRDKEHVVYFDNFEHLIDLFNFYRGNENKYKEICFNGYQLIRERYRTEHFIEQVVRDLKNSEVLV